MRDFDEHGRENRISKYGLGPNGAPGSFAHPMKLHKEPHEAEQKATRRESNAVLNSGSRPQASPQSAGQHPGELALGVAIVCPESMREPQAKY